jgi:MFS transporter, DHA2 family, multidrug resistance protein
VAVDILGYGAARAANARCIRFGMPRQPVNRELLKNADWAGMLYASVGFSLLYAGLDQGNRLDWLNSGLINTLLLGGTLLLVVFAVHELTYKRPWINLRFAASGNMPFLLSSFRSFASSYSLPRT